MAVPESVVWASEVIGFISFAITLLTLLGVYRDVISTVRHAPTQIPIILGNLREEIEAERSMLRRRVRERDEFDVFVPRRKRSRRRTGEVMHLLVQTIDRLWLDFKAIERPFLIRSPGRAEAVARGDYWGDGDLDEKAKLPGTPKRDRERGKRTNAMGMEEANVGIDENYYRTDLTHRFIWWQSKGDVESLLEQVQRVQIRRIERDVFECDELIKKVLRRKKGGGRDGQGSGSGSGSDDPGPRGGGSVSRRGGNRSVSRKGTTHESKESEFIRVPARSRASSVRPGSRAGSGSRVRSISPPRRRSPRLRERNEESRSSPVEQRSSNTARRRAARDSRAPTAGDSYEYEVVRPSRDGTYTIDINGPGSRPGLRQSQGQSYYRQRSVPRNSRGSIDGRDGDGDRGSARYDSDE